MTTTAIPMKPKIMILIWSMINLLVMLEMTGGHPLPLAKESVKQPSERPPCSYTNVNASQAHHAPPANAGRVVADSLA